MKPTNLKKWSLISKLDASPSKYFPIEKRKYKLPDGRIIDDFFVTTIPDAVRIIPITKDKKIVMIRQFKAGANKITIEFPAGRYEENKHKSTIDCAIQELEEETGIKAEADEFIPLGRYFTASTKATEIDHTFLVCNVEFNSKQKLDINEDIEIVSLTINEIDNLIMEGEIADASVYSDLYLLKLKYRNLIN